MKKLFVMTLTFTCLIYPAASFADTYLQWQDQIKKASNGIDICYESYFSSISGDTPPKQQKKNAAEAKKTCAVLKSMFDTTMLAARTSIEGMDTQLAGFHKTGLEVFDDAVPKKNEAPFDYYARKSMQQKGLSGALLYLLKASSN